MPIVEHYFNHEHALEDDVPDHTHHAGHTMHHTTHSRDHGHHTGHTPVTDKVSRMQSDSFDSFLRTNFSFTPCFVTCNLLGMDI